MKSNSFIIGCLRVWMLLVWILPCGTLQATPTPFAVNEHPELAAPPNWSVNPLNFEFSMNMVVRVRYNGNAINSPGNLLGVFVGNQLRGVAQPQISGNVAYYFTTIYSNQYSGETLNFRVYYAPDDEIYATPETVVFRHHKYVGSVETPFWINIDSNADYPPQLTPLLADTTLQSIPFDPVVLADYFISQDGDPVTWSAQPGPNLNASIVNGILTVSPVSGLWTGTDTVRIIVTENTPNQLADTITGRFTVLPDYGAPVWQVIPNQTIFTGQSFTGFDLDNYLTFNGPCRQFDFDVFPFTGAVADPAWPIIAPGSQPMTIIARPLFADQQLAGIGARLAGFVNGVLAGTAGPTGVYPNVYYNLQLKNVGAGNISFKFYHAPNQYLYEKSTALNFISGGSLGSVSAPYALQLSPLVPSLNATGEVQIAINDPSWLGNYPINFIVWDCNFPLQRRDTFQAIYSIISDARPNITSTNTVSYEENACSLLYDTQTSDSNNSEGAGLVYTLAGGADVARFAINPINGILTWVSGFSPDFENPMDANTDNKYQVDIRVTNASNLSDTLMLTVTITNQAVEPFTVQINGGTSLICTNTATTLTASGGVSYLWSNGSTQPAILVNTAGTYSVTATSTGACTATATIVVSGVPSITASGSNAPVCIGATIQLGSNPSGGVPPYTTFAWDGPNGFTGNVQNPPGFPAAPASAGVYRVTVTDNAGCTASASKTIAVSGSSAPSITAMSNSPVCESANIALSSTPSGGSGSGYTYLWSGPNNYGSVGQNPPAFVATLAASGTYKVTLTDNASCTAIGTTVVQVNAKPVITASSNSPVSVGSNIQLSSSTSGGSGSGYAYLWSGPNNFSSAQAQPLPFAATLAANGVYFVTVTDSNGCSGSSSTTVLVQACPSITAAVNNPICVGGTISLQSTPVGGALPLASFAWSGPAGYTAGVEDPPGFVATFAASGTYTVTVTDNLGCTTTASVSVLVNATPSITAANSGPICAGALLAVNSTPVGSYTGIQWIGPDFFGAFVEDPPAFTGTVASSGVYRVTMTDQNGCTGSATTTAIVNAMPGLVAASNSPVCVGANLNLTATPSGGSGTFTSFNWTGPSNFSSSLQTPTPFVVTNQNAGVYYVTVTDNAGCTKTASTSVSVSSNFAPSISAGSNSPICSGMNLALNSTPSGGTLPYTAFSWSGPNNYVGSQEDPTPFPAFLNAAGVYSVTVTDSKNCKGTATTVVIVNGPAVMASSNSPICPGETLQLFAGGIGQTFSWSGPNNFSSGLANPTIPLATIAASGLYIVTVTDNNGCIGTGSVTVFVGDNVPPTISCPLTFTLNTGSSTCQAMIPALQGVNGSDNCAGLILSQNPLAGTIISGHNTVQLVTYTATDIGGNTATCVTTMTLKDNVAPVITCPANTTIAAGVNCSSLLGSFSPVSVSDNCAANPTVTQSPLASTLLSGHNDFRTVTLTANDGNGNTASCTFTVTLKDVTKPSIVCPANMTLAADANCSSLLGSYSAVSVSDNCAANPTVTQSPAPSTLLSGHNDFRTVTLTANDGNGNTESCTFTVTLKDITKPTIVCPANTTLAADANCSSLLGAYSPVSVSDNCTANPTVTQSPAASTLLSGHNDFRTVTLTANDGNGNTESCTFTVTLKDVTKPFIVCPANTTLAADANCSSLLGAYSPVSVSDNCTANPTVTQSPAPSTLLSGHFDFRTVALTADDGNGNMEFCTFMVTLLDVTKPSIGCPANTTLAADANCSSLLGSYSAVSVSDNCTANPTVTQSPAPSTLLSGHNDFRTVTLTANDGNGNTESCTFTVTLKDITKPVIVCPANTTLAADANCSRLLGAYSPVSVSDNCTANPTVTQSPAATTLLSGHNDFRTVTLTANDGNGNTQSCTFTVTLKDVTPPTVVCKPFTAVLDANGNTAITPINVYQSGSDNCGTVNLVSVVASTFNCSNIGANTVTLTANDGNGNTNTCTAVVTVVDNIPPMVVCKIKVDVSLNAAGMGSITPADAFLSGSDNCGTVNLVSVVPSTFTCLNLGSNIVTLTVNDGNGNTATCTTNAIVADNIAPTMICRNVTLNLNANGQATLTVPAVNNGSFDNCTIVTLSLSQTNFTCANLGNNTVTLTGTDQSGNIGQCTATITIRDLIAPVARCKNTIANLNANGSVTVLPSAINNGSTDNCTFTLSLTPNTFLCSNIGVNTVTLRATDGSGNTGTCTATVTVRDVTAPTILCKPATIFLDIVGKAVLLPSQVDNGSTDNCSIVTRTLSKTLFNCSEIGPPQNVFLTAVDASGNSSMCTAQVTVIDNMAPTAVCRNTTVTLGPNGTVAVYAAMLADSSFDNCSVWSYAPAVRVYTSSNLGNNNLTITVKDFSGNGATCVSVVTVLMNSPNERPDVLVVDTLGNSDDRSLAVSLFPNPSAGDVVVAFELPYEQQYNLQVFDLSGQTRHRQEAMGVAGENTLILRRALFSPGIYFLNLHVKGANARKRLIIRE